MSRAFHYPLLSGRVQLVLNAFCEYFNEDHCRDYLTKGEVTPYSMEFTAGSDKFTLHWFYDLKEGRVYFQTYFWQFDPNTDTCFKKILIKNLFMISSEHAIWLSTSDGNPHFYDKSYQGTANSLECIASYYTTRLNDAVTDIYRPKIERILTTSE